MSVFNCSEEIAPCRGCGAKHSDVHGGAPVVFATTYKGPACVVQCDNCGASGPIEGSIPDAITKWNLVMCGRGFALESQIAKLTPDEKAELGEKLAVMLKAFNSTLSK